MYRLATNSAFLDARNAVIASASVQALTASQQAVAESGDEIQCHGAAGFRSGRESFRRVQRASSRLMSVVGDLELTGRGRWSQPSAFMSGH